MTRRVAAIDCGTNSIRLLVADVDRERGTLTDVGRRMEIVRLGQGVDTSGRLAPEALDRTMHALSDYAAVITRLGASDVRMVATSATRDAANAGEFVRRVTAVLGTAPEVLSGDEEARLSFTGATAELGGVPSAEPPYLVVDIGGGSTEFVLGTAGVSAAASVDIGCVRMTERYLRSDPPSPEQIAVATADIDAAVGRAAAMVDGGQARTLVGLAGSVTTVAGIAMGLPAYDSARLHHARVAAAEVHAVATRLLSLTRTERARIAVMHPGRVDVIGAGALILDRIMSLIGLAEVLVSEHDILDGIAWSLAAPAGPVPPGTGWPHDLATPATPVAHGPAEVRDLAASAPTLAELTARQSVCRACPRLVSWREEVAAVRRRSFQAERYWGRPIPGWGAQAPRVLIVGLAPAAHGGNRTGRIFTGDRSGDFLFASLYRCGLADSPVSVTAGDGQRLRDARMVAAVRCAPPANKPTTDERDTCAPWLVAEVGQVAPSVRAIVCLGGFAWQALWPVLRAAGFVLPSRRPPFGHGAETEVRRPDPDAPPVLLLGCYHPSQQNTFTGRVTPDMLDAVFARARGFSGAGEDSGGSGGRPPG